MSISKTKSAYYRRLFVAHLIASGVASVPALIEHTGMPRRTAQDTIKTLAELDIDCRFEGGTKNGHYVIASWGAIDPQWISANVDELRAQLGY